MPDPDLWRLTVETDGLAMPELPGMPKKSVGRSEPPSLLLLAASGAITPSIAPLPNSSGVLDVCTACP